MSLAARIGLIIALISTIILGVIGKWDWVFLMALVDIGLLLLWLNSEPVVTSSSGTNFHRPLPSVRMSNPHTEGSSEYYLHELKEDNRLDK